MPVDSTHEDYDSNLPKWQKCADAIKGEDAIHAKGVTYLPKLKDQTDEDYQSYKMRANYFNAVGRTLDGLVGMVFRKAPVVTSPTSMDAIIKDVDLQGTSLNEFAREIEEDVLEFGRIGVLVEYPQVVNSPKTVAEQEASNLRPYASVYQAIHIINWKVERINNVMKPTLIVLKECAYKTVDEYKSDEIPQLRVLKLTNVGYIQQIYQQTDKDNKKKWDQVGSDIVPLKNGKAMSDIPFFIFGDESNTFEVCNPPLLDLVNLNLAHYRVNADYQHGSHLTGLPMLFLAGVQLNDNEKVYLGSQTACVTDNDKADGKFIEFTGQGLGAIEKNLDRIEKQMAVQGARMLEQQKNGVESQGAMEMRVNGESSVLAGIANLTSQGLTSMLALMADWSGNTGDVSVQLNTDYVPTGISAQDLAELVKSWQAGAISFETLFENLQRGEIIKSDVTALDEQERIQSNPALGVIAA